MYNICATDFYVNERNKVKLGKNSNEKEMNDNEETMLQIRLDGTWNEKDRE